MSMEKVWGIEQGRRLRNDHAPKMSSSNIHTVKYGTSSKSEKTNMLVRACVFAASLAVAPPWQRGHDPLHLINSELEDLKEEARLLTAYSGERSGRYENF